MSDYFDRVERQLVARVEARGMPPGPGLAPAGGLGAVRGKVGIMVAMIGTVAVLALVGLIATSVKTTRPSASPGTNPGATAGVFDLTPCTFDHNEAAAVRQSKQRETNSPPDRACCRCSGSFEGPRDRTTGVLCHCALLATHAPVVHAGSVRYLAPGSPAAGCIGRRIGNRAEFRIPGNASAQAKRELTDPAACLITVGYVGSMSGVGGCFSLGDLHKNYGLSSSTEIVNAPLEQQPLIAAGFPRSLRSGSIVSGLFPDRVARVVVRYGHERPFTVQIRDNYGQYHTPHSAPVAVRTTQTLKTAQGRVIGTIP